MSSFLIEIESVRQGEIPGLILFGMRAALFMDPSMNRADSVALMQIAFAHLSLAYLPSVPVYLPRQQKESGRGGASGDRDKSGKGCTQAQTINLSPYRNKNEETEDAPPLCLCY